MIQKAKATLRHEMSSTRATENAVIGAPMQSLASGNLMAFKKPVLVVGKNESL